MVTPPSTGSSTRTWRLPAVPSWLPVGHALPDGAWWARHRVILVVLWLHVPALYALGVFGGTDTWFTMARFSAEGPVHSLVEVSIIASFAAIATVSRFPRRVRSVAASAGLVTASAILTHFSGGFIEAHFHFFVMLGVIAMYQDWIPFLFSIAYVAFHHGIVGTMDPGSVFNHPAAIAHPWRWAALHATFVLGLSLVEIAHWRANENARSETDQALQALGRREAHMRAVVDGAPIALIAADRGGRVTACEGRGLRVLGRRSGEVVGVPVVDAFPELTHVASNMARAIEGTPTTETVEVAGSWYETRYEALTDEKGACIGSVCVALDVTQQRLAEESARVSEARRIELEKLGEIDRVKTALLNMASHELNTPITPMMLQLDMITKGRLGALNPKQERAVKIVDRNVRRLAGLVGDVLDAVRLQHGELRVRVEDMCVGEIVAETIEMYHLQAEERDVRIETEGLAPCPLKGDRDRIAQVVVNLVGNALKFTPRGGRIAIRLRDRADDVVVEVADTGPGLSAEQMDRLFDPFVQVHEPGAVTEAGTGLGLYICKGIVERHGGRIWVKSAGHGQGATFGFVIPKDVVVDTVAPSARGARDQATNGQDPAFGVA